MDGDVKALAEEIYVRDVRTARENILRREALIRENLEDRAAKCPAEFFRPARRDKLSLADKTNAGAALRLVHIRSRHDDRDALLPEIEQKPPQVASRNRIDAGCRFIQEQQFWRMNQRARQRQLLPHAAGKLLASRVRKGSSRLNCIRR